MTLEPHPGEGPQDLVETSEPVPNPGLPAHEFRPTDVDPVAERRAERQVSGMFGLATVLLLAFCVAYFALPKDPSEAHGTFMGFGSLNLALGLTLGLALLLIGLGAIQWAKKLMDDHEVVEMRHSPASTPEDRTEILEMISAGASESGFGRRTMIRNSLFGALGALLLPTVVLLRAQGPLPGNTPKHTVWTKGMRVVNDVAGTPIKPSDIEIGQLVNAEPSLLYHPFGKEAVPEGSSAQDVRATSAVILVRMRPDEIHASPDRTGWGVDGILCYSKICTHVGCAISLYEHETHHVLCPCHQSTFDLADNGKVLFGPAHRPLPQLPLAVDAQGYLIAQSDFTVIVGPSFPTMGDGKTVE